MPNRLLARMTDRRRPLTAPWRWSAAALAILLAAGLWSRLFRERIRPAADPLPPIAGAAFLNTRADAAFVGIDACVECHPQEHRTWSETAHSRAFDEVAGAREPAPGGFFHVPSGRNYQVLNDGKQLRHRESARTAAGDELLLAELPLQFVIGSGRFSRSYLANRDGFLVESPLTWYAAVGDWGMSPGYDVHNPGFERPINGECMGCHVGRADHDRGAVQRFHIQTQAIDCERCHGPGSLHVEYRRSRTSAASEGEVDLTIANPARMSRAEREDVCAQCHLHSAATVDLRGRRRADFRPGLRLRDFCLHYALETPQRDMRVVGHVEQMRLSACYRGSDSLTCTTCHDPHSAPPAGDQRAYFRSKCLTCHAEAACGLSPEVRRAERPDDDCMVCHMPTSETDIAHFAFTHHRIGVHRRGPEPAPDRDSLLVPLDDVSHLPQIERDRCAGLAYLQAAGSRAAPELIAAFQQQALNMLEDVRARGLNDAEVDAALARLLWGIDQQRTIQLAESVLAQPRAVPESRVTALFTLATTLIDRQDHARALPLLEELVTLRLSSEDWYLLSVCRRQSDDLSGALAAAERAAEISPQFPQLQEHVAALLDALGRTDDAAAARARARQLRASSLRLPQTAERN